MQSVSCVLSHLAGFLTVGIKGHLLGGQLTACVGIITEVDLAERPAPQELSLSPVDWRPRRCRNKTPDDENPPVIHVVTKPPEPDRSAVIYWFEQTLTLMPASKSTARPDCNSHTSPRPDVKSTAGSLNNSHRRPAQMGNPWYLSQTTLSRQKVDKT